MPDTPHDPRLEAEMRTLVEIALNQPFASNAQYNLLWAALRLTGRQPRSSDTQFLLRIQTEAAVDRLVAMMREADMHEAAITAIAAALLSLRDTIKDTRQREEMARFAEEQAAG